MRTLQRVSPQKLLNRQLLRRVENANAFISADDKFEAWWNGVRWAFECGLAPRRKRFEIRSLLKPGLEHARRPGENAPAPVNQTQRLIVSMEVSLKDGSKRM